MPLSEKEKQALKEKYRQQRRAMWGDENEGSSGQNQPANTEEPVTQTEPPPPPRPETTNIRPPANEVKQTAPQQQRPQVEATSSEEPRSTTIDAGTLLREKIREQREETWEGQSSPNSRRRKQRRQTGKSEREFWDGAEDEEKPRVLTWKLVLGVVASVILLIGAGVLLGYWFAS